MILLILLALLSLPLNASAVTYFIAANGSDSNSGTSSGSPWKTINKAEGSGNWSAGNSFLFRCGDTWRITGNDALQTQGSGSSGNPITIGSYGTCNTPADYPIFTRTVPVTGWTSAGTNLWQNSSSGVAEGGPNWFFNNLRAAWIENHSGSSCPGSMTKEYEVCYKNLSTFGTVYVRTTSGDPDNLNSPGAERLARPSKSAIEVKHDWITITKIHVWKTANCISVNSPSNLNVVINDVTCEEMGWKNTLNIDVTAIGRLGNWGINVNVAENATGNFTLTNSRIIGSGRDSFDIEHGMPDGDVFITNNFFSRNYNHGIAYLGKDSGNTAFASGTWLIQNNEVSKMCGGLGYGEGSDIDDTGGFANLRIIGNFIHDTVTGLDIKNGASNVDGGRLQYKGGATCGDNGDAGILSFGNGGPTNVYIAQNRIERTFRGIQSNSGKVPRVLKIYNNTIVDSFDSAIFLGNGAGTIEIFNNVLSKHSSGTNKFLISEKDGACANCNIKNNYFDPSNTSNFVAKIGGSNKTVANLDSSNLGNAHNATPSNLFVNRSADNYTPGTGSPLINKGRNVQIPFVGLAPDIGAIEVGSVNNPPPPDPDPPPPPDPDPVLKLEGCTLSAVSPNQIVCEFDSITPPLLPATFCDAGWMLTGAEACISGCTRTASEQLTFTLDHIVTFSETPVLSYDKAVGSVMDSASVELENITNFPVINNSGGNLLTASNISASTGPFAVGREPTKLFDGDITTEEGSTGNSAITSFSVTNDLGLVHTIGVTRLFGDNALTWRCSTYGIEYSQNCTDYTTFATGLACDANTYFEQTLNQPARCLRLTVQGPTGGTQAREWQAFEGTMMDEEEPPHEPPPPVPPTDLRVIIGTSATGVNLR